MRRPTARHLTAPLAAAALLATTAAGCGSSAAPRGSTTHVAIQNPGSAYECRMTLTMGKPVQRQLTATLSVSCNFPAASAKTTLVIQGRTTGSGEGAWDNVDDPVPSILIPPVALSATAICLPGHEMQASADITGIRADGEPFHADETTTPHAYTATECNQ